MTVVNERKKKVLQDYRLSKHDTGSAEVQVALLTDRINHLSEHFKANEKDHHSRYGLIKMVGKRKSLLSYIRDISPERYQSLITRLELRK